MILRDEALGDADVDRRGTLRGTGASDDCLHLPKANVRGTIAPRVLPVYKPGLIVLNKYSPDELVMNRPKPWKFRSRVAYPMLDG